MKLFVGVALVGIINLSGVVAMGAASADTLSVQGDVIKVQAAVAAQTYVIVDNTGKIIQIDSNNNLDINPVVYSNKVQAGNERPLTADVARQYRILVPLGKNHIGTLYKQSPYKLMPHEKSEAPMLQFMHLVGTVSPLNNMFVL